MKKKSRMKRLLDKTDLDDKAIRIGKKLKREYKKTLITAVNAGFAFLIALYMRDFIKDLMEIILTKLNLNTTTGILYQMLSALFVVALCVVAIIFLSSLMEKEWQIKHTMKKEPTQ